MTEAFDLLNVQPNSWPRWRQAAELNGVATNEHHLFLLELVGGPHDFGRVYPACHFVGGARPVNYDRTLLDEPGQQIGVTALCPGCQEVELQHALNSATI